MGFVCLEKKINIKFIPGEVMIKASSHELAEIGKELLLQIEKNLNNKND